MMQPHAHVVFRVDAGAAVGMGHVMRCSALAGAFRDAGWRVDFAVNRDGLDVVRKVVGQRPYGVSAGVEGARDLKDQWPDGVDLLIVDHYGLDRAFETACRPWAKCIGVIDDMTDRQHDCDVLLNPSPGVSTSDYAGLTPEACTFLLAPRYALLREQFHDRILDEPHHPEVALRLLVTLGGSDPDNIVERVVDALRLLPKIPQTRIILGSAYAHPNQLIASVKGLSSKIEVYVDADNMADHMSWCDMAVSAAGSTTWELCAMGVAAVYVQTAENQNAVVRAIQDHGIGFVVGNAADINARDWLSALSSLMHNPVLRAEYARNAHGLVDGQGTRRVVETFTLKTSS